MYKTKTMQVKSELETSQPEEQKNCEEEKVSSFESFRDFVESLVFALLLAFFIKTFEAEAFVIPTGSMAPTLKGRHKDLFCDQCGFRFQVNASEEMDNSTNRPSSSRVVGGTCPQCGFTSFFGEKTPSFNGDRILVSKCTFDDRPVHRWDVSVFRAPAEPKINFIKRIVGLPNERLRIQYGDIFVQKKLPDGQYGDFEIMRKPLTNLQQMLQTVYDNDYPLKENIYKLGWPKRWYDLLSDSGQGVTAWVELNKGKSFQFGGDVVKNSGDSIRTLRAASQPMIDPDSGNLAGVYWLRYRHIVPSSQDWFYLQENSLVPETEKSGVIANNPQLILDFSSYNAGIAIFNGPDAYSPNIFRNRAGNYQCRKAPSGFGANWTGDLSLSCKVTLEDSDFTEQQVLVFELVKGGQKFLCRLHPLDGRISLEIPGIAGYTPDVAVYPLKKGSFHFQFINIDEQMRVVIDGSEVEFPQAGRYDQLCKPFPNGQKALLPRNRDPNARDLSPAAIGVRGLKVKIDHLKILRDIYYIATGNRMEPLPENLKSLYEIGNQRSDHLSAKAVSAAEEDLYTKFLSDPQAWSGYGNTWSAIYDLEEGQYLALGDNSGLSHDSRLWSSDGSPKSVENVPYYVVKKYMMGKAFFVYWPHGSMIPGTKLPFVPEFSKMRHID